MTTQGHVRGSATTAGSLRPLLPSHRPFRHVPPLDRSPVSTPIANWRRTGRDGSSGRADSRGRTHRAESSDSKSDGLGGGRPIQGDRNAPRPRFAAVTHAFGPEMSASPRETQAAVRASVKSPAGGCQWRAQQILRSPPPVIPGGGHAGDREGRRRAGFVDGFGTGSSPLRACSQRRRRVRTSGPDRPRPRVRRRGRPRRLPVHGSSPTGERPIPGIGPRGAAQPDERKPATAKLRSQRHHPKPRRPKAVVARAGPQTRGGAGITLKTSDVPACNG